MKRFHETTVWEDPWFRKLPPESKLLWQWLHDKCDCAGIVTPDLELAQFQIGCSKGMDTLLDTLSERVQRHGDLIFLPCFIPFQYGQTLRTSNSAHLGVVRRLQAAGIQPIVEIVDDLNERKSQAPSKAPTKGLPRGSKAPQDKDKDKEQDKEKDQDKPKCRSNEEQMFSNGECGDPMIAQSMRIKRPTKDQAIAYGLTLGIQPEVSSLWWEKRDSSNWIKGSGGGGRTIIGSNWQADLSSSRAWATEEAAKIKAATPAAPKRFIDDD